MIMDIRGQKTFNSRKHLQRKRVQLSQIQGNKVRHRKTSRKKKKKIKPWQIEIVDKVPVNSRKHLQRKRVQLSQIQGNKVRHRNTSRKKKKKTKPWQIEIVDKVPDLDVSLKKSNKEVILEQLYYTCRDPNQKCYPRYQYMNRRLKDLRQRHADLYAIFDDGTTDVERDMRFVILGSKPAKHIETNNNSIENALFPNGDTETKFPIGGSLQEVLTQIKTDFKVIVFMHSQMSDSFRDIICINRDVQFVIVVNNTKEQKQNLDLYDGFSNVKVSVFAEVKDTASVALEETIFKPMKYKAESLIELLTFDGRRNIQEDKKRKCNKPRTYINTKTHRKRLERKRVRFSWTMDDKTGKRESSRKTANRGQVKDGDQVQEKIREHRDSIECLLGEILGLYSRSKVPEKDRPVVSDCLEQNVSDEVAAALYAIDASVKSCGYRYSTLQVFVDDTSNGEINDKIREVLRKNNISNCDIVPSIGSFKPLYKVGAKVHPKQLCDSYATVGGFAKKNTTDLCALVSRHVALRSTDGTVCLSNGDRKIQASIIPETLPEQGPDDTILDISAAEIRQNDNKNCDTRFKTEDGDLTTGKESDYDTKQLRNMPVHIWGATTSPGLGIITMPEIRDRYEDDTFIIVEDRHNKKEKFSRRGDSGSIVCADDIDGEGVEVISMLIGEDNDHGGRYATFKIDKGLEQLRKQTNDDFHLCKD